MVDTLKGDRDRRREVEALLVLDALPRVGPATVRAMVEAAGSARRALGLRSVLDGVGGPGTAAAAADPDISAAVRLALRTADRLGMETLVMGEDGYPARLLHLVDPPPVLFLRGDVGLLRTPGVAIVGSRRCHGARPPARPVASAPRWPASTSRW